LIFALQKIGAWYVPINFVLSSEEIKYQAEFAEPTIFFVQDSLIDKIREIKDLSIERFGYINVSDRTKPDGWYDIDEMIEKSSDIEPEIEIDDEDIATLFYTSGTEAPPKGVMNTHENYYAVHLTYLSSINFINFEDTVLMSLPLIHMAGYEIFIMAQMFGATVVMQQLPEPEQVLKLAEKHRITVIVFPPTVYVGLASIPIFKDCDLTSMRLIGVWGSILPRFMIDSWHERCPNAQFFTLQGSSESTATALTGGLFRRWEDIPNEDGRYVGRVMAIGNDIKLVDDEDKDVPIGQPGEQLIMGPLVFKGYYKMEEKTKEVFRGGWFHTGDVLMTDEEGNYFFVDRKKDMVKSGGENVSTEEVEGIINLHSNVLHCAVFGVTHPYWGEAVTAAVVPKRKEGLTAEEIISFCKERLAGYKVPKHVIITDSLPMTSAGKLLKRKLRKIYKDIYKDNFNEGDSKK